MQQIVGIKMTAAFRAVEVLFTVLQLVPNHRAFYSVWRRSTSALNAIEPGEHERGKPQLVVISI